MRTSIFEKNFRREQRELLMKHFDADDTMFLERELTQLRARMFEVAFPELVARSLMPFANDIAPSAETYSYKVLKPVGDAKIIGHTGKDLPRVDAVVKEILGKVHPIGLAYGWDINELREAARLRVPISDVKARVARDAAERAIDELLSFGDLSSSVGQSGLQLTGLLNNADVVAQGIDAATFWLAVSPPTPAVILAQLGKLVSDINVNSNGIFTANTVLLPIADYQYIAQTPFSTITGESILSIFKKNNDNITLIKPWYRLATAGAAGVPRAIAYQRDPKILEGIVPQEFEQLPPQAQGLEFVIPCTARCGGVKIYQPLGMKYMDFATS